MESWLRVLDCPIAMMSFTALRSFCSHLRDKHKLCLTSLLLSPAFQELQINNRSEKTGPHTHILKEHCSFGTIITLLQREVGILRETERQRQRWEAGEGKREEERDFYKFIRSQRILLISCKSKPLIFVSVVIGQFYFDVHFESTLMI